jgi:ornithine cyclodeaminase/alanine dehydrogenase-like protein (mu-crystallin family)
MAFYGFEHRYGANMRSESGNLMGTLYVFQTRAGRDTWLADGNEYQDQTGARTALRSRHAAKFQRESAAVEHVNP